MEVSRRALAVGLVVLLASSLLAPVAAGNLDNGDERADLDVRQPSYVEDSVDRKTTDNRTVYSVQGPTQELRLEGINHSRVEAAGVLEGSGSLEYDETLGAWIFDAEGEAGTRVIYFDVVHYSEETRQVADPEGNGTTTETYLESEKRRHVATLKVENVEWAHRPASKDEQLREDAANWSSVASTARRMGGGDDVETVLEDAFGYYKFAENPFASFMDDARGTVMMATRPGGLAVFGGLLGLATVILGFVIVKLHRRERELEVVGDVDEARDEAYLEMAEKILQQKDYEDFLPEHLARFMRDYLGRNCYLGFKRYLLLRSPTHTKGLLLQLMGQVGYVGRAVTDQAGEVVEASVVHKSDLEGVATDGGEPTVDVDLTKLDADTESDRRFVDLVPGDDLDIDVVYQPDDLDLEAVEWPIDERHASDSRLLEGLNPEFPDDFEDEEQLADVLSGFLQLVANHEFTDEDGRPREERDLLSFLAELDSILTDHVDFPLAHVQRRMLFLAAERMDKGEELQQTVDRLAEEGLELGGELDLDSDDDDPDGDVGAITTDDGGDDGDDPGALEDVDEEETDDQEPESVDENDADDEADEAAHVDGDTAGEDGSEALPSDEGTPLIELAEAAGYDVYTEAGLDELAENAGLSWDMDDEEISSRVLVHCRREIPTEELIEILNGGGER
jgi:catechol-2,3-dioxygenase